MGNSDKAPEGFARRPSYFAHRFGVARNGDPVSEHVLKNAHGVEVRVIDYGAIITRIIAPDRDGRRANIVLGYDRLDAYEDCPFFVGAVIGRYAGRIRNGAYREDGALVELQKNSNGHCLHGGVDGFGKKMWKSRGGVGGDSPSVEFGYAAKHNEGGFPGALHVRVRYTLTDRNELVVAYEARCSAPTHVNLTQHSYFNLSGAPGATIRDHELVVPATRRLETDVDAIPTGAVLPVANTAFDFRQAKAIGDAAAFLDHDFVIDDASSGLKFAGAARHPESGRRVDVATDQPSLHVYAGAYLRPVDAGRFVPNGGLCLETQHYPNTPNIPAFPSTRLEPRDVYRSRTVFTLSTE